jgi:hypothetical protein
LQFIRVMITSNNDWVIPAGKDERRFCVIDVGDGVSQNHAYFAEMDEELDNGGREALLADLLAFDLSTVNLRQIPKTGALLEQKMRSLEPVESWWFERLQAGSPISKGETWLREAPIEDLFDDYLRMADRIGVKRKNELTAFGIKMKKLVPDIDHSRPWMDVSPGLMKRVQCYLLPSIVECREAFERALGQSVEWQATDDVPGSIGAGESRDL